MAKLKSNPAMNAAMEARWAELEAELAEQNRAKAERAAAEKAAKLVVVMPRAPRPAPPPEPVKPLRDPVPVMIWAADIPIVLPDPLIADRHFDLFRATCAAIRRKAVRKPGDARRLALLMEGALGVTADDRARAGAEIRALVESLGSPAAAADLRALAGKRKWRDRPLAEPAAPTGSRGGKGKNGKKADVKFSDGPTPERAAKSVLVEEPQYIVEAQPAGPKGKDRKPERILVGRAMRDIGNDAEARLSRFGNLEVEHIRAGARLAADWEKAGLEPRVTVNLMATGGGSSADAWASGKSHSAMQARDRLHLAVQALSLGGLEVVHVVEAVAVRGDSAVRAASAVYTDKARASAHVATTLKIGLNLLVRHYKIADQRTGERRAAKENA